MSEIIYKPSTKQGGQSLVEAAVLMPILLLVLLGVLDLGRTFFAYVTVASAAREGARYASIHPSISEDAVRQRVVVEMGGILSGGSESQLSVQRSSLDITDTITVTVRYNFTTLFLGPVSTFASHFGGSAIIPNPITLAAHAAIPISPGNYAADQANNIIATATVAAATATPVATSTPTQSPTITPTPSTAWVTLSTFAAFSLESITVSGCNFHNSKTVNISWDGANNWTATTNSIGCFGPTSITIPASVSGSYHTVAASTQSGQQTLTGTASPQLQISATPTATSTATRTSTATATGTATATATRTATATATPIPIVIYTMTEGDAFVSGTTAAGVTIEVRDMSATNKPTIGSGTVAPSGVFSITVSPTLVADHMILLSASNDAVSSGWVVPAIRTATPTPSATATGTATTTATATPTATAPTPQACTGSGLGGTIYAPGGSKLSGVAVSLLLDGQLINTAVTGGSGTYNFTTNSAGAGLTGNRNYLISAVEGGYGSNWTAVYLPCGQSVTAPDITMSSATPTATSTSSPPSSPALSWACTYQGSSSYHSLSWSNVSGAASYRIYGFNTTGNIWQWITTVSTTSTDVAVSTNSIVRYYVTAVNSTYVESYPSNMVQAVCGSTPTPTTTATRTATPSPTPTPYPDLYPISISTDPGADSILTGQPVAVTVFLGNQGTAAVNSVFWVDLYVDPTPAPPTVNQSGVAWQAVNALGAGQSISVTFSTSFAAAGTHILYFQTDYGNLVIEGNEGNNVSNPYVVSVNAAPTPTATATPLVTPTPTSTPAESPTPAATATATPIPGSISGDTYIYTGGAWSRQGRIAVYVYSGSAQIASGFSDAEGYFDLAAIPPGTYSMVGEAEVNGQLYSDTRTGVVVSSGQASAGKDLFLFSW